MQISGAQPASGDRPSTSGVYRNVLAIDGFPTGGEIQTLFESFE